MTRKRSKYTPRGANPNAWKVGMQGAMRLSVVDQIKTLDKVRAGVDFLIECRPSREAWAAVFDCVNLIEAFSAQGLIQEGGRELVQELQSTVVAAMERQRDTGSNVLRPTEIQTLEQMVEAYGEILKVCTHRELFQAMERVQRKVKQALAMGSHGSVKVLEVA